MVAIKSFRLKNFRGVKNATIPIDASGGRVITLIGLNESGKTSILEGISLFPISDRTAASIFSNIPAASIEETIVPIHETGIFSGEIEISGRFELEDGEWDEVKEVLKKAGYEVDSHSVVSAIDVMKRFEFEDGDHVPSKFSSIWGGFDFSTRKSKRSKFTRARPAQNPAEERTAWNVAVDYVKDRIPQIVFFPNFIVEVPRKIYISEHNSESRVNKYYRRIIESTLRVSNKNTDIKGLVLDRIDRFKAKDASNSWISSFLQSSDRDKVDAIFLRLSGFLTQEVIGSWSRVFNRSPGANRIDIKFSIEHESGLPYVELRISDGRSAFHLNQKSLGFRWFFSFLLFTRFGREVGKRTIFLFDEPAANLHARAQSELLSSFSRLSEDGDIVIYSTHSHHMINPAWLSDAFIVLNDAIDYETGEGIHQFTKQNNIKLTKYRRFVGENGSKVSYFQPVLDRLQYSESGLTSSSNQVLVEGVSDFYALNYALKRTKFQGMMNFVPGTGSGSLSTLISLSLARSRSFFVLLDDDEAGRRNATKYRDEFFLNVTQVGTIGDLHPDYKDFELETLISANTRNLVKVKFGSMKKKSIGMYLAELSQPGTDLELSDDTLESLCKVVELIGSRLKLD